MAHRKVTYTEQCWYILRYWIKRRFADVKHYFYHIKSKIRTAKEDV